MKADIIPLSAGDTLAVFIGPEVNRNEAQSMCEYFSGVFPNNKIIILQDYKVTGMSVFKEEPHYENMFLKDM